MDIAIGLMILFSLVWFWRIKRKALLQLEYQYKLRALRDELRWKAINGEINTDQWIYALLDSSILVAAKNLTYFNLYSAIGLGLIHKKDKNFIAFRINYDKQIQSTNNKTLRELDKTFSMTILEYVIKKHIFFRVIFKAILSLLNRGRDTENKIKNLRHYPETSASKEYMPHGSKEYMLC